MKNIPLCPGDACPVKYTCRCYLRFVAKADDYEFDWDLEPAYKEGKCDNYIQQEYYGQ